MRNRMFALLLAVMLACIMPLASATAAASDGTPIAPAAGPMVYVSRIFGADRYQTAIELSKATFGTAGTVVLTSGEGFADALAASCIAGAWEGPLLLTRKNTLPDGFFAELTRLGTHTVIIVGGEAAVSASVEAALAGRWVVRIAGVDRYDTAAKCAAFRNANVIPAATEAWVARGDDFADALAASPIAYGRGMPVFLTRTDSLPAATASMITTLGISELYVAGGDAAVSPGVATQLESLGTTVTRLAGVDRFDTAQEIADYATWSGWASPTLIGVATGRAFPDALAGGSACGSSHGVLLLTNKDSLPEPSSDHLLMVLNNFAFEFSEVQIYGGTGAVSSSVMTEIEDLVQ